MVGAVHLVCSTNASAISSNCIRNDVAHGLGVTRAETHPRGVVPASCIDPFHVYVVAGLPCQHKKKRAKRAAVAFAKRQLDRVFGGARRKIFDTQPTQAILTSN